jgi:SprT protein
MDQVLSLVPEQAKNQVEQLLNTSKVSIKITKKRQTKHGDFRKNGNGSSLITLNTTSNPYRFLITLLHELAHFRVSQSVQYRIKPHGKEWKNTYRETLLPFLNPEIFPEPLCTLLASHMINPKASTDRDFALVMALKKHDPPASTYPIFELKDGQQFELENGRKFVKIKKRRTRFECKELDSGKIYLFSPHAEVVPVAPEVSSLR